MRKFVFRKGMNMNDYTNLTIEQINTELNNLTFLTDSIILSATDVAKHKEALMNAKDKKILETYPIRIWQTNVGTWKAHVPDPTKDRGRRNIEGKTQEHLEKNILKDYHKRFDDRLIFANYFAEWLTKEKIKHVQPATVQRNLDDYNKFIKGKPIDKMNIKNIQAYDIKDTLHSIINEHHLTRKTLGNVKSIFSGMFTFAFDKKDIQENPMNNVGKIENTNIRPNPKKKPSTQVFDKEDLPVLTEYIAQHYMEHNPIVSLATLLNFQLGLRVGELCTIKKKDVDFVEKTINVDRTEISYRPIYMENGKLVKGKTVHDVTDDRTKDDSNRIIALTDFAMEIIKIVLQLHKTMSIESDFLFADINGNHIIRQRINDCLKYYCDKLSMDVKSSHKIRKTFLSNLFRNGFDIDEVMLIAGHRVKSTTVEHYLFTMELDKDKHKKLNKAVGMETQNLFPPTPHPSVSA